MPAKRKSGKWANDTKSMRKKSKSLVDDTKALIYRIEHPEAEPDPETMAESKANRKRCDMYHRALSGDTEALIWCGQEFLDQK